MKSTALLAIILSFSFGVSAHVEDSCYGAECEEFLKSDRFVDSTKRLCASVRNKIIEYNPVWHYCNRNVNTYNCIDMRRDDEQKYLWNFNDTGLIIAHIHCGIFHSQLQEN